MLCNKLGMFYDLMYLLTEFFSSKQKNEWIDYKNVPSCLYPFFYKRDNGESFMQTILKESYEELLQTENIEVIQNKIMDYQCTVNRLVQFYFNDDAAAFSLNNPASLLDVNKKIVESSYPSDIKSLLYSLFIEPVRTIHELMGTLLEMYWQIERIYENSMMTVAKAERNIQENLPLEILKAENISAEQTVATVCVFDNECVKVIPLSGCSLLILGKDYSNRSVSDNYLDLKSFGYVFTEENRIKILDMMKNGGEIGIKDVEQKLQLSGTNAYYHLSLMIKSGVVKTRYQGRTVFYSIDRLYLRKICTRLFEYCEG